MMKDRDSDKEKGKREELYEGKKGRNEGQKIDSEKKNEELE